MILLQLAYHNLHIIINVILRITGNTNTLNFAPKKLHYYVPKSNILFCFNLPAVSNHMILLSLMNRYGLFISVKILPLISAGNSFKDTLYATLQARQLRISKNDKSSLASGLFLKLDHFLFNEMMD